VARLVRWVSRVCLVSQDPSVRWESKARTVPRVSLARSVSVESRERVVLVGCVARLVLPVLLVPSAFAARVAQLVSKARWVLPA